MTDSIETPKPALFADLDDNGLLAWAKNFRESEFASTVAGDENAVIGMPGDFPVSIVTRQYGYGFRRVYNDGCGGADVSDTDKVANARKKRDRHLVGIWTERGGAPGLPAHESLAIKLATAAITAIFAGIVGKSHMVRPRPVYELTKGKTRDTFGTFGAPDGKGWVWKDDPVSDYIARNGLIDVAKAQIADAAEMAAETASDIDAALDALTGATAGDPDDNLDRADEPTDS